jgi:phage terminase small subunit
MKLTNKQRLFCLEYIVDLNATQAAIRAGYCKKNARQTGYENLTKPYIEQEIQRLMDERAKKTEITAEKVLKELAKIGFSDITDFVEFGQQASEADTENGNSSHYVKIKASAEVDGSQIAEVRETRSGLVFKLHDKTKALELMGRHLGMFKEMHELDLKGNVATPKTFADWMEIHNAQKGDI